MRKIAAILFSAFLIFPICGFAFEIKDLPAYKSVVAKTFTASDSIYKGNKSKSREVQSTIGMVQTLGDKKVYYKTDFTYVGDEQIKAKGQTTWYFYTPKSLKGKRMYKLDYEKHINDAIIAGRPGDTLVIGRKSNDEIDFVMIDKDHEYVAKVYEYMLMGPDNASALPMTSPEKKKSPWWSCIFGCDDDIEVAKDDVKKTETIAKADDKPTAKPKKTTKKSKKKSPEKIENYDAYLTEHDFSDFDDDDFEPIDFSELAKTDVEIFRDNETGLLIVSGTPTEFTDGDTIKIQKAFNIRITGTDTPEKRQNCINKKGEEYACGKVAAEYLKKIVGKDKVACTLLKYERFGRSIGDCETIRGKEHIGRELIKAGHAIVSHYPPIMYDKEEAYARDKKLGMWKGEFQHPHCWRHRKDGKENKALCGTKEFWKLYPDLKSGKLKP